MRLVFVFTLLFSALNVLATDEDEYEEGFLTAYLNRGLAKVMTERPEKDSLEYGRNITKYVSVPQFRGFIVGQYSYSDERGRHGGEGFNARHVRAYVSGSVLRDFRYRIQMEFRGTPALRDYTIEWVHWKEFSVKVGQFKRPFTFESPLNPWNVGLGGYSAVIRKLVGYGDYCGETNMNGRDQGLMLQGNLLPVGRDKHALFHYEASIFNGNGQNKADNNRQKDWMGSVQVIPITGLRLGIFGWKGTFTDNGIKVGRNRWAAGATFEKKGWIARGEYIHHVGHRVTDYDAENGVWNGKARADGWYALLGVSLTPWFTPFVRYDAYRDCANWDSMKTTYSICPNFQLHHNLMFQLQYNYVSDRSSASDRHYNEFWAQAYIRF